ncbi:MAG: PRC-barrel domain-containing protein [Bacteroidales bacterium]|jgi:16S rRNA processing protein RimM|nr:PRC-barrel domain-containing protein [Bacteroidales bacterium]
MKKADFIFAGKLLKTGGKKGEVILSFDNGLPKDFLNLGTILIDIDGGLVPFFVEEIKQKSSSTVIVKLEDVDSEIEIKKHINSDFYLSSISNSEIDDNESLGIQGFEVYDATNILIGKVIDYFYIPNNPIIKILSSQGKEFLIPFNENLIIEFKEDKKKIIMKIPEGIMNI